MLASKPHQIACQSCLPPFLHLQVFRRVRVKRTPQSATELISSRSGLDSVNTREGSLRPSTSWNVITQALPPWRGSHPQVDAAGEKEQTPALALASLLPLRRRGTG
jgi:hypothetical protein